MEGAHGLPRNTTSITSYIQQVLHGVGKRRIVKEIKAKSVYMYYCRVIERINEEEGKSWVQT